MNRAVVIRTTAGLARHLISEAGGLLDRPVVVGFDARPTSRQFAEDTAGVLAAVGLPVVYFREFAPTPLVAFAAKQLGAAGAVVVTASHNPRPDNGYKVYASNGAQIIPPTDADIAAALEFVGSANEIPRLDGAFAGTSEMVTPVPGDLLDLYWEAVNASRPSPQTSEMKVVYTPMHGVGGKVVEEVFRRAGHSGLIPVPLQMEPDGTFPTVAFPNPEEEGALDLAIELAAEVGADLIIANDPDADRLAVVVPQSESWRPLSGNEIGVLLGDYILRNASEQFTPIVINSIVSSPMLGHLAAVRGAHHEVTLTGFKWIANAGLSLEAQGKGQFVFGFEEALGYTIGTTVRDKDGISAALVFCDLVAGLHDEGRDVLDRLSELWREVGLWVSAQHSIVRPGADGAAGIRHAMTRLADNPPHTVGTYKVERVVDYRQGAETRPFWLGAQALIELSLGAAGRVLIRPSGTEPKLKIYVDLREEAGEDPLRQHSTLNREAKDLAADMGKSLGL
jgi:phosphomannomutase